MAVASEYERLVKIEAAARGVEPESVPPFFMEPLPRAPRWVQWVPAACLLICGLVVGAVVVGVLFNAP